MSTRSEVTGLLRAWSAGDATALDRLIPLVYDRLSEIAHAHLRDERTGHTLNTTALVHETYLKLVDVQRMEWRDQAHFRSMASRLMRRILVDHARRRAAGKRPNPKQRSDFREDMVASETDLDMVLDLDRVLGRLEELSPRQSSALEQRYFGGLTVEETAAVLGVSVATAERDLRAARAFLAREWAEERGR